MRTITAYDGSEYHVTLPVSGSFKLLYVSHLALGDYIYQGPFLKALVDKHPNIQLDVWIDDCRQKKKSWHAGRSQALVQWLSSESHINYVYPIATDLADRNKNIQQAYLENYDAIVFIATSRNAEFAEVALKIASRGKIFGTIPDNLFDRLKNRSVYKKLDGQVILNKANKYDHISNFYADLFKQFFNIQLNDNQRLLKVSISHQLKAECAHQIHTWVEKHQLIQPKAIFINHLSTSRKRDWKLSQLEELLLMLGNKYTQSLFILNAPPSEFEPLDHWTKNNPKIRHLAIETFTAKTNFFELPSIMSLCNLVISVETSIMHLASSLNIKQIALIRQSAKHWRPLNNSQTLEGKKRVDSIAPYEVLNAAISLK